jgi:hypothetical protein
MSRPKVGRHLAKRRRNALERCPSETELPLSPDGSECTPSQTELPLFRDGRGCTLFQTELPLFENGPGASVSPSMTVAFSESESCVGADLTMLSEEEACVVHVVVHSSVQADGLGLLLGECSDLDEGRLRWVNLPRACWSAVTSSDDAKARGFDASR